MNGKDGLKAREAGAGGKVLGTSRIDSTHRITIAADVMKEYGLQPGDLLLQVKTREGELLLRKG